MPENTSTYVMQIQLQGTVLSQQTIANFYYASPTFSDPISAVLLEFADVVGSLLEPIATGAQEYDLLVGQMVKGSNLFSTLAISLIGSVASETLPPFVTWDFTLLRGGAGERNGYKRFSGIPESLQQDGVVATGAIALLDAVATAIATPLDSGDDQWTPVIRRTMIAGVPQSPPKYFSVSDVVFSQIGTQNSRKFGHGG